jgi:AcrR family transcriptional regulator
MKQPVDTKSLLLNAAEAVFAREGYRAASLRAITNLAAVNLAAVNYHFGSKRGLVEAVFARRLLAMNQARVRGLAQVRTAARAAGQRPDPRTLIGSFIEATLDHSRSGPGERHFMAFIVRSFSDADRTVQQAFERFMKPVFEALRAAMAEALPQVPPAELWWRLQFTLGALIRVQHLALSAEAGKGRAPQTSEAEVMRRLTDFVHAGLTAPPAAAPPVPRPASAQGETP